MVATSISPSPSTSRPRFGAPASPRPITTATPASDSTLPSHCRRRGCSPYSHAPSSIIHTGPLDAISVAFTAVVVVSAAYCSALYSATPVSPSPAR